MAARALGIDEGTATLKAVEVERQGGVLVPVRAVAVAAADGGGFDAAAVGAALKQAGIGAKSAVVGLTGKDLVIKYQQVPPVPDFQLKKIVAFELEEIRRQSGDDLVADFNVMPVSADLTSDDLVLLALAREQRITERSAALAAAGIKTRHFTPNSLALFHAFRAFGPATAGDVLVASIGRTSSDFAVLRDGDLLYARSVSTGGDVLTDALVEAFNVSKAKAESLKLELGSLLPRDRRQGFSAQQEKVCYALEGAAGRLFSLLQSTLALAKSQMQLNQLNVGKVWLTGGSAAMRGLDDYLASSLGVPVQKFDPLAEAGVAVEGPAASSDMTVALGLAVMAADPEAFSVEVLTAAERRRRDFATRHVFTAAAILLVAIYLGFAFTRWKESDLVARRELGKLQSEQNKRKDNASRLERLKTERTALASRVDYLEKRKAAGDGLVRALKLLATMLPEDLWATALELEFVEAGGAAKDRAFKRPAIIIDGSGRSLESRNADDAFSAFIAALKGLGRDADVRPGTEPIETVTPVRDHFNYNLNLVYLEREEPPPDPDADAAAERPDAKKTGGR